ncbi:MAG: mechanosensitive ion channel family protein [Hahellaceae bacterium]|nr:mechanosensitive ion channel family protein [Hahellaceae bacterium]MCP5209642.1 mechanosensitive ion channel family protein [Hahellaceae bacterium]
MADHADAQAASIAQETPIKPFADTIAEFADWLPDSVRPVWELIAHYPAIGSLAIIVIFYLAAFVVRNVLLRYMQKLLSSVHPEVGSFIFAPIRQVLFTTMLYLGLILATKAAMLPFGSEFLINIFGSVIIGSWIRAGFLLSTAILELLGKNHERFPLVEPRTIPLLDLTAKLLTILIGSYCLLIIWGINPVGWLASAGVVGIAVGFAAKDTLANLFSGFFILIDAPYKVGDYINLDSGERGRVTNIGLRSTRLISRDDIEITLPNSVIANAKISNESGGPNTNIRIKVPVGVAYGSDADKVCDVLLKIGQAHPELVADPAPRIRMRGFGASSLDFELLAWISQPEDRGRIMHELFIAIYKALATEGIEIPYAKTDVYIKELPKPSK